MEVSVIVVTYNPSFEKAKKTLVSIKRQKNVNYEVIIADDGSKESLKEEICKYANSIELPLKYVGNIENQGTIRNILSGVYQAIGDYVYITSPGDLLYDDNTLKDFYDFAMEHKKCGIFFGKAIYYNDDNGVYTDFDNISRPFRPYIYSSKYSLIEKKINFFHGDNILGAAYFRERKLAKELFEEAATIATYTEDKVSTALALCRNNDVIFYDREIIWYEMGTGISTNQNNKWINILKAESDSLLSFLKENYSNDKVVDSVLRIENIDNKRKKIINRFLHHPILLLRDYLLKWKNPVKHNTCTIEQRDKLLDIIGESK